MVWEGTLSCWEGGSMVGSVSAVTGVDNKTTLLFLLEVILLVWLIGEKDIEQPFFPPSWFLHLRELFPQRAFHISYNEEIWLNPGLDCDLSNRSGVADEFP